MKKRYRKANKERAHHAEIALETFRARIQNCTNDPYYGRETEDEREDIIDLLSNLMHYCDQHHLSFSNLVNIAHGHFEEEQRGES